MCIGFYVMMVSMAFSAHINVMVFARAVSGVVSIQTSGAIWVGKFVSDAFQNCNDNFEVISTVLFDIELLYRMVGLLKAGKVW